MGFGKQIIFCFVNVDINWFIHKFVRSFDNVFFIIYLFIYNLSICLIVYSFTYLLFLAGVSQNKNA